MTCRMSLKELMVTEIVKINEKYLIAISMSAILLLSGCAYVKHISNLNSEPIYITRYRGYPPVKEVIFGNKGIDYELVDKRIEDYLNNHPELDQYIVNTIRNYSVCKGMTKDQVAVIANPNTKEFDKSNSQEIWIYGSVAKDGRMIKIIFVNSIVEQIDIKYWTYTFVE